jgi:UPF0716 protein FxsA
MGALFLLVFLLVSLLEIVIFIWVQDLIGLGATLLGAFVTAIIGGALVRRQGLAVWARFRSELEKGGLPGRQLAHGAMVLVGGALLITPGFLTDLIGFSLMVPFIREAVRRIAVRFIGPPRVILR